MKRLRWQKPESGAARPATMKPDQKPRASFATPEPSRTAKLRARIRRRPIPTAPDRWRRTVLAAFKRKSPPDFLRGDIDQRAHRALSHSGIVCLDRFHHVALRSSVASRMVAMPATIG